MLSKKELSKFIAFSKRAHLLRGKELIEYKALYRKSLVNAYIRKRIIEEEVVDNDNGSTTREMTLECGHFVAIAGKRHRPTSSRIRCPFCSAGIHRIA